MAKFLNYEDRREIQNGLKKHLIFTLIGKSFQRDRTTVCFIENSSDKVICK
ncbi:MAG: hypothetical protein K2N34_10140 [Lachnospiraceae bacterium]|nr:hypothetical protein [Lachnospiraceae bacterium]